MYYVMSKKTNKTIAITSNFINACKIAKMFSNTIIRKAGGFNYEQY